MSCRGSGVRVSLAPFFKFLTPQGISGSREAPFFYPQKGGLEQNPGPDMGLFYGQQAGAAGSAVDLAVGYALGRRNQG